MSVSSQAPSELLDDSISNATNLTNFECKGSNKRCYIYNPEKKEQWQQWWNRTVWAVKNTDNPAHQRKQVHWGSEKKTDKWDHFRECALVATGEPHVICNYCNDVVVHPATGHGTTGLGTHLKSKACTKKSGLSKTQQTTIIDGYQIQVNLPFHASDVYNDD